MPTAVPYAKPPITKKSETRNCSKIPKSIETNWCNALCTHTHTHHRHKIEQQQNVSSQRLPFVTLGLMHSVRQHICKFHCIYTFRSYGRSVVYSVLVLFCCIRLNCSLFYATDSHLWHCNQTYTYFLENIFKDLFTNANLQRGREGSEQLEFSCENWKFNKRILSVLYCTDEVGVCVCVGEKEIAKCVKKFFFCFCFGLFVWFMCDEIETAVLTAHLFISSKVPRT